MTKPLTEDEIRKFREFCQHEGMKNLLPYAEFLAAEAELSKARRMLWTYYRKGIIILAGVLVAMVTISDKATSAMGAIARWASSQ